MLSIDDKLNYRISALVVAGRKNQSTSYGIASFSHFLTFLSDKKILEHKHAHLFVRLVLSVQM